MENAIQRAIEQLQAEISDRQTLVSLFKAHQAKNKSIIQEPAPFVPSPPQNKSWTPARRKEQSLRSKAMWRKRKAQRAQNRVKVTKIAAKKG